MKLVGLIVDDDEGARLQVSSSLQQAARTRGDWLEILEAKTALGAARIAREVAVDFAILDYDLPNGLTGVQLAVSLVERQKELLVCMFSAKDESLVDMALQSAFGRSTAQVQYKAKPVTAIEWKNFYEFARKQILRSRNEFLFDDLDELCRGAFSGHERLRLLNLLGERSIRTVAAIFGAFFPPEVASFVQTNERRPFITANSFVVLAEKLATQLLATGELAPDIKHLATSLKHGFSASVRLILKLENDNKHRQHIQESELRTLLAQKADNIERIHEFIADLRNVVFFAKEQDNEYCNRLVWFNKSRAQPEEIDLVLRPNLPSSGALVSEKYLDIRPLMMLDRCDVCKVVHPFQLNKVDLQSYYFGWSCSSVEKKIAR